MSAPEQEVPAAQCTGCSIALPLAASAAGSPSVLWACRECGSPFRGSLAVNTLSEALAKVQPVGLRYDRTNLPPPPEAILRLLRRLAAAEDNSQQHDQRRTPRYAVVTPAWVVPMNRRLAAIEAPFSAAIRNVSSSGLSIVHTRSTLAPMIAVEFPTGENETRQFVFRVRRCQPLHHFYEIAGPFLIRLDHPSATSATPIETGAVRS
jgi:hypothetical protein